MNNPILYVKNNQYQKKVVTEVITEHLEKFVWRPDNKDTLIDVGSATGDMLMEVITPLLAKKFQRIVCSDLNPRMVEFAKSKYQHLDNMEFKVLDIGTEFEIPDDLKEQFDHVISFYCVHLVKDQMFDVNARNPPEFILYLAISIWQHSRQSSVEKLFAIVNKASQSTINQLLSNCLLLLNEKMVAKISKGGFIILWHGDNKLLSAFLNFPGKAFKNVYSLIRPEGGDCLLNLFARGGYYDAYTALSKTSKWSKYMTEIDKYTPLWHYTKNPEQEARLMLEKCGFTDIKVNMCRKFHDFDDVQAFKETLLAVSHYVKDMPEELQQDFMDDWHDEVIKADKMCKLLDESSGKFRFYFEQLVIYARRTSAKAK